MTLDDIWKQYETYSKTASDGARQLSLAGIAIVWVFKVEKSGNFHLEGPLLSAGTAFVGALASDLLQFIGGTIVYLAIGLSRERGPAADRDKDYPGYVLWPIDLFFWIKFGLVIFGYFELLRVLLGKLV